MPYSLACLEEEGPASKKTKTLVRVLDGGHDDDDTVPVSVLDAHVSRDVSRTAVEVLYPPPSQHNSQLLTTMALVLDVTACSRLFTSMVQSGGRIDTYRGTPSTARIA